MPYYGLQTSPSVHQTPPQVWQLQLAGSATHHTAVLTRRGVCIRLMLSRRLKLLWLCAARGTAKATGLWQPSSCDPGHAEDTAGSDVQRSWGTREPPPVRLDLAGKGNPCLSPWLQDRGPKGHCHLRFLSTTSLSTDSTRGTHVPSEETGVGGSQPPHP